MKLAPLAPPVPLKEYEPSQDSDGVHLRSTPHQILRDTPHEISPLNLCEGLWTYDYGHA